MNSPTGSDPNGIEHSIVQTLTYCDHFNYPLTKTEIHRRLIATTPHTMATVLKSLEKLTHRGIVGKTSTVYHLPGRKALLLKRLARYHLSDAQLTQAMPSILQLSKLPYIKAIYLTGSLAMSNSTASSDIDLMIIAEDHHLWTARFLLMLYTSCFGLRRTPHTTKISGKLCLNLFLTPQAYELPLSKQNLYTAYELIQAKPVLDPHNTRDSLLVANSWLHHYLPNFPLPKPTRRHAQQNGKTKLLEYCLYSLQYLYMKNKITREYITLDCAFFHPHDPGKKVLRKLA